MGKVPLGHLESQGVTNEMPAVRLTGKRKSPDLFAIRHAQICSVWPG